MVTQDNNMVMILKNDVEATIKYLKSCENLNNLVIFFTVTNHAVSLAVNCKLSCKCATKYQLIGAE